MRIMFQKLENKEIQIIQKNQTKCTVEKRNNLNENSLHRFNHSFEQQKK